MGVRLSFYVVDLPDFERFVEMPIGDVMQYYVAHSTEADPWYLGIEQDGTEHRFEVSPATGIHLIQRRENHHLRTKIDPGDFDAILSSSIRTYLSNHESIGFLIFFDRMSVCASTAWIKKISTYHRRWWIGSLLQTAERIGLVSEKLPQAALLLRKILRVYNCGYPVPDETYDLSDFDFPVLPQNDIDPWLGIWTDIEIRFMLEFFHTVLASEIGFQAPPGKVGIAPRADSEWDNWVNAVIKEILVIETLDFKRPYLISFID